MNTKKIEDLILSIDQVQHLKSLGYSIEESVFVWNRNLYTRSTHVDTSFLDRKHSTRTLTLQEILNVLPSRITIDTKDYDLAVEMPMGIIMYRSWNGDEIDNCLFFAEGTKILDVAYETLCWVVEKGFFAK